MTGLKKGIEMKPIQMLVLVTALGAAAGAQNTNPNAGKPSPTPTPVMKPLQKGAAATPPAKPAPAKTAPSQNSGPKLIVPPKPGEKMPGAQTAGANTAGAKNAGANTAGAQKAGAPTAGAKTGMPATTAPASSAQKAGVNTAGAKPPAAQTAGPKSSAAQTPGKPPSALTPKTAAVPQKTPVLTAKPASKPAVNAGSTKPASTLAPKKTADKETARKKNEEPPVKIVPQQKASNGKSGTESAPALAGAAGRRDPFLSIIRSAPAGSTVTGSNCSVGKRCLYIPDLELKGIARDTDGQWMAVVVNNTRRAYFLRENDQVFNGFGCSGKNVSPPLQWSGAPVGTKSFALTVYDPDAPTGSGWWHWIVYNVPASVTELPLGAGDGGRLPAGAVQARTDFGTAGYGGPCPPPGDRPHHYVFTVYALKTEKLDVPANASAALVAFSINANKLASASITASYGR